MIRNNLKAAVTKSGLIVKEIAFESGVNKRTIDKWLGKEETEPKVIDLYKVCVTLGVTLEEIIDGENGVFYIRSLIEKKGILRKQAEQIQPIVKILEGLDDTTLTVIEKMISGLK